jgi:pyruvate dehydrogenase E2 component (dihydrolipoamide acetyltransferase)
MKARGELNAVTEASGGPKFTVNDFVLKAVVAAAAKVPAVNASFAGDAIIQYGSVNLERRRGRGRGPCHTSNRDAQKKSLREIRKPSRTSPGEPATRSSSPRSTRAAPLPSPISAHYGIETFSRDHQPTSGRHLAVGRDRQKPVVGPNDQIVVGQRMSVGLSADHRVSTAR